MSPFCRRIIGLSGGRSPLTYAHFIKSISGMKPPPVPVPALSSRILGSAYSPVNDDHDEKYGVPSLAELGENQYHQLLSSQVA